MGEVLFFVAGVGAIAGAIGVVADRVMVTDDGLAIYGWLEIEEGQARPVVWVEPGTGNRPYWKDFSWSL